MTSINTQISELPIPARQPTGTFTGEMGVDALVYAHRLISLSPGAAVSNLSAAISLALTKMSVGEQCTTGEYIAGKLVGGNTYVLKDAGNSASRPANDGGRVIHVGTNGLYLRCTSDDLRPEDYGVALSTDGSDTAALQQFFNKNNKCTLAFGKTY